MPSDLSSARFGAGRGSVSLSRKEWVSIVRLNIHNSFLSLETCLYSDTRFAHRKVLLNVELLTLKLRGDLVSLADGLVGSDLGLVGAGAPLHLLGLVQVQTLSCPMKTVCKSSKQCVKGST